MRYVPATTLRSNTISSNGLDWLLVTTGLTEKWCVPMCYCEMQQQSAMGGAQMPGILLCGPGQPRRCWASVRPAPTPARCSSSLEPDFDAPTVNGRDPVAGSGGAGRTL